MIELVDFCKSYSSHKKNDSYAVEGVSFKCLPGVVTGIVGENGSGKSTILKAVTGNHYASSGSVFLTSSDGTKIDAARNPEKVKAITGYVPENPVLPSEMKVRDFVFYVASLFHTEKSDAEKAREEALRKCGLESVSEKKIRTLSKGFRQRVSFAQALTGNPSVLVLDEPFSGLDPSQIIQMRTLILEESKNKTVLVSTHNLSEVHNLCSSVLVMKNGRLAASGTEEEIILKTGSKTFEEAFLKL